MLESIEVLAALQDGYLRVADMTPILGVTKQRCHQLVQRDEFPPPTLIQGRRLWERVEVERWRDEVWPRAWRFRLVGGS